MGRTETAKFVVLNPDEPVSDLVFLSKDWSKLVELLGQPLVPEFLEVEYEAGFSKRGRLNYMRMTGISDERYRERYEDKDLFLALRERGRETERMVSRAMEVVPDEVKVFVDADSNYTAVRIYANNEVLLEFRERLSYRLVKLYGVPESVRKAVEEHLLRKGFRKGEYGGLVTKIRMERDERMRLIDELKSILQASVEDLREMFRERIVRARNTVLWVDDWDPEKTLEEDVREKLMRAEGETEGAEIVEETAVSMEEVGRRILEDVEGVELEPIETPAVSREVEEPRKPELVKVYLLKMRLPSKYLVQRVRVEKDGEGFREIRDFSEREVAAVASRLEGVRRAAYEMIARHFVYVDGYGMWIAVSEDAVRKAEEVGRWVAEELKALGIDAGRYFVRAVPVYLEVAEARELLGEAVRLLESEKRELEKRVREAEAEKKRSALRKLEKRLAYKQALLESFRKYLASLG